MGLNGFLRSSNFIDGGVTGVSMLVSKITPLPLSFWLPVVNLPFIAVGYRYIGRAFAVRSVVAIAGLAAAVALIPYPDVTPDKLLTAVFGGFFLGAGIGLAVRGGAVLDGTEIAALLISRRIHALRVGDLILGFNVVLFLVAMSVLGVEAALYSILTYMAAAKTLDFVLYGLEEFTAVTIVSRQSDAIRQTITGEMGRGVTAFQGYGGMHREGRDILLCVVTRLEVGRVKEIVRSLDEKAFVTCHALSDAEGGVIKKTRLR
ncbi:MAG: YitT family protein [Nitrospirae bacterium]|nr:YitT family protein [Nitrospirota bacterium]